MNPIFSLSMATYTVQTTSHTLTHTHTNSHHTHTHPPTHPQIHTHTHTHTHTHKLLLSVVVKIQFMRAGPRDDDIPLVARHFYHHSGMSHIRTLNT